MSGAISVRRGGVADAAALRTIRLEALADTPEAYGSTYVETVAWDDARWREVAQHWTYFLAFEDDVVIGMASGGHHESHPGTHWLFGMYVTPRARGTGVAELLVERVASWARDDGAGELHLSVTDQVPRARAFYEKLGFHPSGGVATLHRDASVLLVDLVLSLD